MSRQSRSLYKPLLLTTTMRNPERLKNFLRVLSKYDGKKLSDEIIQDVAKEFIIQGLYKPVKVSSAIKAKWKNGTELGRVEASKVYEDNPQDHKEAGFEKGWPSRFDTWFKIAKELGLVWYEFGGTIMFSETSSMLLDEDNPQYETFVFANAFSKYYRNNPFKAVLNSNNPLILLVQTIQLLNQDDAFNNSGISKKELPLLLCWRDGDARKLYTKIKQLRDTYGFTVSNEVILKECYKLIDDTKRNDNSILVDYPDEFMRKMRLTGLITLRGGGRFIDINTKELEAVEYIAAKDSTVDNLGTEYEFYEFISTIDEQLLSLVSVVQAPTRSTEDELQKWVDYFEWSEISTELLNLCTRTSSRNEILRIIEQPLRLEFLTSLAVAKNLPDVSVRPNYVSDDEGLPTSFAPGGGADILCVEGNQQHILIEVTLLKGAQQHIRESFSIKRHLQEYVKERPEAYTIFISPQAYIDTVGHAKWIRANDSLDVRIVDIPDFVDAIGKQRTLSNIAGVAKVPEARAGQIEKS